MLVIRKAGYIESGVYWTMTSDLFDAYELVQIPYTEYSTFQTKASNLQLM